MSSKSRRIGLVSVEVQDEKWRRAKSGPDVLVRRWRALFTTDLPTKAAGFLNAVRQRLSGAALRLFMDSKPRMRRCRTNTGRWVGYRGPVLLGYAQIEREAAETAAMLERAAASMAA